MTRAREQPPPDPLHAVTAPEGYHLEWVEEGTDWKLATDEEKRERKCRRPGCKREVVAALDRGHHRWGSPRRPSWWFYCDWHLYGRRVRDGKIEYRKAVEDEAA